MKDLFELKHNNDKKYRTWKKENILELLRYNEKDNLFRQSLNMKVPTDITLEDMKHHMKVFVRDILECDESMKENLEFVCIDNRIGMHPPTVNSEEMLLNSYIVFLKYFEITNLIRIKIEYDYYIAPKDSMWSEGIRNVRRFIKEEKLEV